MAEFNEKPIIEENVNGNVLFSMQYMHYGLFKNKRVRTLSSKTIIYFNNFAIKHRYSLGRSVSSKKIFKSIEETTNYLLERNGLTKYKITNDNRLDTVMEFRQTNCFSSNKNNSTSHFDLHKDDYGPINSECISIIYYIRKDQGIKGGNFLYKEDKNLPVLTYQEIDEGDVLIFKGNLEHTQEPTYGIGCRDTIGVFIPI
jgi:hypothetical protein